MKICLTKELKMKNYELVIEFLKIINGDKESQRFVRLFKKYGPARFALIKLSGAVIEESVNLIAMDLAYLSNLDLYPIVIHGGGKQIDIELKRYGMHSLKRDGIRITAEEHLPIIKKVLDRINYELVDKIIKYGGRAQGLTENVFLSEKYNELYGYVGKVKDINFERIINVIKSRKIPIISCLGSAYNGHYYNINADEAAKALVLAFKPRKYVILTDVGGIRDVSGNIISNICLERELKKLESQKIITGGMLLKVKEANELLNNIRYRLPIQITSSRYLLKELFTYSGKGTFIKLGTEIEEYSSWEELRKDRIEKLVLNSFGRKLIDGYFELPVESIIIDKKYKGMAVIRAVEDMHYLDKFCVSEEAQGQGIGQDIWFHIINKFQSLFWRARKDNSINLWYFQKADGCIKLDKWIMYWINLNDEHIKKAKEYVLSINETLQ